MLGKGCATTVVTWSYGRSEGKVGKFFLNEIRIKKFVVRGIHLVATRNKKLRRKICFYFL